MPMSAAQFAECPRFPETRFEFRPKQSPAKQLRGCRGSPFHAPIPLDQRIRRAVVLQLRRLLGLQLRDDLLG